MKQIVAQIGVLVLSVALIALGWYLPRRLLTVLMILALAVMTAWTLALFALPTSP